MLLKETHQEYLPQLMFILLKRNKEEEKLLLNEILSHFVIFFVPKVMIIKQVVNTPVESFKNY